MQSRLSRCLGLLFAVCCVLAIAASATDSQQADTLKHHRSSKKHRHHDDLMREEWSSIMGWVSIACWVIVYSPQMHQNYVSKSAEGLSITFIVIWLAGDALNAAGAWFQGLLWTMIILALYYCACDCVLIFQYWFYGKFYHRGVKISTISAQLEADERTPLVADGSVIEEDMSYKEEESSIQTQVLMYTLAAFLVFGTGVAAWYVAKTNGSRDQPRTDPGHDKVGWRWDAQAYGWMSALLYLSSRVPQILKNRTTKCEGLSLALFIFAVAGNLTYVASILLKSLERDYLIESASWLVGSLGTIFLDFIVLGQFIAYRQARKEIHRIRRSSIAQHSHQDL